MTTLLGLDIGLAHCGIAALAVTETSAGFSYELLNAGVVVTEKRAAKVTVSTTEDNVARMRKLAEELKSWLDLFQPKLVVTESQSWPRNAGATGKIGMAWGVVTSACLWAPSHPRLIDVSPQAIKLAVCKNKSASKEDVIVAMTALLGSLPVEIKKADREHACDAAAAVVAAVQYREDVKLWIARRD